MASRYHFAAGRPSLGETIGSALGTGLGSGLTRLAESKLDTMLNRQKQGQLTAEFVKMGIPEGQAAFLAKQSPETQWQTVRQWWMSQGYDGGDLPGSIHEDWESGPSPLQELSTQEQPSQAGPQQGALAAVQNMAQDNAQMQGGAMGALAPQAAPAPIAPPAKEAPIPKMPKQRKARDLGEAFRMAEETTPKTAKEESEIAKETRDYYDKVSEESRAAKNNEIRLKKLEKLIDSGKLNSPTWASTIKFLHLGGYGPDLGSWLTADTQEFQKLSTDFIKDAKQIFGARMTDQDLKSFLDTIPNITQSDEAKRRVIKNMRVFNEAARLRKNAMDQIIEANGGRRPRDLDVQVERFVEPYLDQLAGDFKQNESTNKPFIGQQLKALPEAKSYPAGTEIRDKKSGVTYRSDGNSWKKV